MKLYFVIDLPVDNILSSWVALQEFFIMGVLLNFVSRQPASSHITNPFVIFILVSWLAYHKEKQVMWKNCILSIHHQVKRINSYEAPTKQEKSAHALA